MQSANNSATQRSVTSPAELAPFIDHTLLKPEATTQDILRLCAEAVQHGFMGVCVQSSYVGLVAEKLRGSSVLPVSVIGFPLGGEITESKVREAELAIAAGAREIDMVIRIGSLKEKDFARAEADIAAVVRAAGPVGVKVIVESGLLSQEELVAACKISEAAGAAFVKTATGFLGRGASLEDIATMRRSLSPHMKIKASGGIKTFSAARDLILAGADRLGTSSGVQLIKGEAAGQGY